MAEAVSEMSQPLSGDKAKTKFEEFFQQKHYIFPKFKKVKGEDGSFSDVTCGYICEACGSRIFSKAKIDSHIASKTHGSNRKHYQKFKFIKDVPAPSPEHESQLCSALNAVWENHGMVEADMQAREGIQSWFQEAVERDSLDCDVRLIGSSKYGAGLRYSPVDVDLSLKGEKFNTPQVLLRVRELVKDSGRFRDIDPDFASKRPTIFCTDSESGLKVNITAGSSFSDERSCCRRERSVSLSELQAHFRASTQYIIDNLLKLPQLENHFSIETQIQPPVLPVLQIDKDGEGHDGGKDGEKEYPERVERVEEVLPQAQEWKTKNKDSIAKLWLALFRFYLLDFKREDFVINVRSRTKITREDKSWNRRRLAIEDPFARKYRVGDPLQSSDVFNYIMDAMGNSFRYFARFCDGTSSVSTDSFKFEHDALVKKHKRPIELYKDTIGKKKQGMINRFTSLPPLTDSFEKTLSTLCFAVCEYFSITADEEERRKAVVRELERNLQKSFPGCQLCLFGSSVNAFGLKNSDLDICMLLDDSWTPPEGFRQDQQIRALGKNLKNVPNVTNVKTIATAKVPICKFLVTSLGLEADISFYNVLAQRNSSLLRTYAFVDTRVRQLGFMIKYFAKVCEIGDASKGSLSSYAYIIMLLHYLQNCKPPVVPVLQDLYEGSEKPKEILDGWDCWFFNDLKNLKSQWPGLGKNNESVGKLLVGFFRYYVEKFNFFENVVSIRQDKCLTKFEKMWNGSYIAIEDPFNLSHNLGRGVSESMYDFISSSFSRGRERFGISNEGQSVVYPLQYFFDKSFLVGNKSVPTDRLCRICGHVGHRANTCERRRQHTLSDVPTVKKKIGKKGKGTTGKQAKSSTQNELDNDTDLTTVHSTQSRVAVNAEPLNGEQPKSAPQTSTTDLSVAFHKIDIEHEKLPGTSAASDEMSIASDLEQLAMTAAEMSLAEDDYIVLESDIPTVRSRSKNLQAYSKDTFDTSDVSPVALSLSSVRPIEYGLESNKSEAASSELGLLTSHTSMQPLGVNLLPTEVVGMPANPLCPKVSSSLPSKELPTAAAQWSEVLPWQAGHATCTSLPSLATLQEPVMLQNLNKLTCGSSLPLNSSERGNSSVLQMLSDVKPPLQQTCWPSDEDFAEIQGSRSRSTSDETYERNTTFGRTSSLLYDRNPSARAISTTSLPGLSEPNYEGYSSVSLPPAKESTVLEGIIQSPLNSHYSSVSRQRRALEMVPSTMYSIDHGHSTEPSFESSDSCNPIRSTDKKPRGMSFDEFLQNFKGSSPDRFSPQRGPMSDNSSCFLLSKLEGADDTQCRRSLSFGDFEDHEMDKERLELNSRDTTMMPEVRSIHSTGDLQGHHKDKGRGGGGQTSISKEHIFGMRDCLEASGVSSKDQDGHKFHGKRQSSSRNGSRSSSMTRARSGIYRSRDRRDVRLSGSHDDEVSNSGLNCPPSTHTRSRGRGRGRKQGGSWPQKS